MDKLQAILRYAVQNTPELIKELISNQEIPVGINNPFRKPVGLDPSIQKAQEVTNMIPEGQFKQSIMDYTNQRKPMYEKFDPYIMAAANIASPLQAKSSKAGLSDTKGVNDLPLGQKTATPLTKGKNTTGGKTITLFRGSDKNPIEQFREGGYVFGTTSKKDAMVYGKNVGEIKIKPQNLVEYNGNKISALQEIFPQVTDEMINNAPGYEKTDQFFNALSKVTGKKYPMKNTFKLADEILLPYFKNKGFDAVKFLGVGGGDEYMIIDPSIIKSLSQQPK